jgi:uncharacterized protein (DUF4415 family)
MREEERVSSGQHGATTSDATRIRHPVALDTDVFRWFQERAACDGGDHTTLINAVLRDHIRRAGEPLERTLRRVLREELRKVG